MESVKSDKKIITSVIIIVLLTIVISTINVIVLYYANGQNDEVVSSAFWGLVKLAVIGSILYFLYLGHKVARGLIAALALFNGIIGSLALVSAFNLILLVEDIAFIAIGIGLIVSKSVSNFLSYQRGEYQEEGIVYESEG